MSGLVTPFDKKRNFHHIFSCICSTKIKLNFWQQLGPWTFSFEEYIFEITCKCLLLMEFSTLSCFKLETRPFKGHLPWSIVLSDTSIFCKSIKVHISPCMYIKVHIHVHQSIFCPEATCFWLLLCTYPHTARGRW